MQNNKIQLIDLGLPSGTLWADRNLGANSPEDTGDYFRFGETTPLTENSPFYEYEDIKEDFAGTDKDAATIILGGKFRTPTYYQIKELVIQCTNERTTLNGVKGIKATGPNGNSIFLPVTGFRTDNCRSYSIIGSNGYCWSASPYDSVYGYDLRLYFSNWDWDYADQAVALPIRAVASK